VIRDTTATDIPSTGRFGPGNVPAFIPNTSIDP
jgi:hypothetical protein